jgi:hypothetical protein
MGVPGRRPISLYTAAEIAIEATGDSYTFGSIRGEADAIHHGAGPVALGDVESEVPAASETSVANSPERR